MSSCAAFDVAILLPIFFLFVLTASIINIVIVIITIIIAVGGYDATIIIDYPFQSKVRSSYIYYLFGVMLSAMRVYHFFPLLFAAT